MQKRRLNRSGIKKGGFSRPQSIKLSVSIGIFLSLALIKVFDPTGAQQLSLAVDTYIGDSTPSTFASIGEALSGGGNIIDVFENLSAALTGAIKEDELVPEDEETVKPFEQTSVPYASAASEVSFDANTSSEYSELPSEISSQEIPVEFEGDLLSGGGFGVDDTLPLPFGFDAPPNVDFTMQIFDFEYTSPLNGVLTSDFGYRNHPVQGEQLFHYGMDIAANKGTDILAFASGVVTNAGVSETYGNYLLISHGDGVSSFYAHCNKLLVKSGAKISKGQVIAQVGNTGLSTGPHLHFELRRDDKILDPGFYIWDI